MQYKVIGVEMYTLPVVPHEAVPEVSQGKVYINQKKNVPIEIVCVTCSNTSHFAQPFF